MKKVFYTTSHFYVSVFLMLFSIVSILAQSEQNTLRKIEELKSSTGFNEQNEEYIDLVLELAKLKIRSNADSASILLKEGYDLSLEMQYKAGESTALSTYGYLYFEEGKIEKAHEYNTKALDLANSYYLNKPKLKALNNMGLDYWLQGEEDKALTKFLEALAVATEINDVDRIIGINVNIANLYSSNGDNETALTFLGKAKNLSTELANEEVLAYTLINMATIYADAGDFEEAERMVNQSLEFFKKQKSIDWMSHAFEQKGSIALEQEKYKEALGYYLESEKLCDEIDFSFGYTLVYNGLAECYLEMNNIEKAEEYGLKGLAISTEQQIAGSIKKSNLILSKVYHLKGEDELAYKYQSTYMDLYEKSSTEKFKKGLGILRSKTKYENEKRQLIANQEKAIAEQKKYVYLAIAALAIVSLFLVLLYRTGKLQKKYNKKLQEKQDALLMHEAQLEESNKTKDKLFSIIAHDLKGPINSFYTLMKMTSNETISKEDYNTFFPQALRDIQGISEMLNNLLIWAKTQMKGIVLDRSNIKVCKIVKNTVSILTPLAEKKEIDILNNIPEKTISYSDANHVIIIVRNLISNAIKYTNKQGKIVISVTEKEDELQIEVADDGVGMDKETQEMLFQKKHIKSTFGTNNEKGTGLGLSICKDMVESNGGRLWVASEPNKGTSIFFTISKKMDNLKIAS
ncbi:tetratricopeptide repeat-containing sensor histidine kinase [Maribacter forsetii]|uniref:tetratricopeptide repeat-containing sensor histidine kinase n=1 Tax=Maribacter forsetii TaxID=444515 RepID=UPI000560A4D2|nr:tetratricopeptide repeat protein [Maribacter forsetii]